MVIGNLNERIPNIYKPGKQLTEVTCFFSFKNRILEDLAHLFIERIDFQMDVTMKNQVRTIKPQKGEPLEMKIISWFPFTFIMAI